MLLDSLPYAYLQIELGEDVHLAPQQRLPEAHLPVAQQPGLFKHLHSELALSVQPGPQLQPSAQQEAELGSMHFPSDPHSQLAPQEQLPPQLPAVQQVPSPEHWHALISMHFPSAPHSQLAPQEQLLALLPAVQQLPSPEHRHGFASMHLPLAPHSQATPQEQFPG